MRDKLVPRHLGRAAAALVLSATLGGATAAAAQTVRVGMPAASGPLDPHAFLHLPSWQMFAQIYDPLIRRNPDGAYEPALATEWHRDPDDPRVWTVTLRDGVTFHHGAAFTADDVVFSFERARHGGQATYVEPFESVTAIDSHTVRLVTAAPEPALAPLLAPIYIMSRDWAEANDAERPVPTDWREHDLALRTRASGTGPYQVATRERGAQTILTRNDSYWGRDRYPMDAERLELVIVQNEYDRFRRVFRGDLDLALTVPVQYTRRLERDDATQALTSLHNRVIYLGFNHAAEQVSGPATAPNPGRDRAFRRGIHHAIDRATLRDAVMHGLAEPTGTMAPPLARGFPEELAEPPTFDPERAQALIDRSSYEPGVTLELLCPEGRYYKDAQLCREIVRQLEAVNVDITLTTRPWGEYFSQLDEGNFDLYFGGWQNWTSQATFDLLYASDGAVNHGGFQDADFDDAIAAVAATGDPEKRAARTADLWEMAHETRVYSPLHAEVLVWGARQRIDIPVPADNIPQFVFLEIVS